MPFNSNDRIMCQKLMADTKRAPVLRAASVQDIVDMVAVEINVVVRSTSSSHNAIAGRIACETSSTAGAVFKNLKNPQTEKRVNKATPSAGMMSMAVCQRAEKHLIAASCITRKIK